MRAAVLAALLVAGCTAGPGVAPSASLPVPTAVATATATASVSTPEPSAAPSATLAPATVYTADDEQIAALIRAGAEEAMAQLKPLNDMDPGQLEDRFLPLGTWIAAQKEAIAAYTPSSCTSAAVALFIEGMDRYDDIRERFMAWRDWGAHGHAFPVGAPGQARATFTEAVAELEAHCPA
jgi:hypothetical protein